MITPSNFLSRLRERGVLRVAASYAVIAWLVLQIADVALEPFDVPNWVRRAPIIVALLGFPIAIALAWFFELGDRGITRDAAPDSLDRPVVHGARRFTDIAVISVLAAIVGFFFLREAGWLGRDNSSASTAFESSSLAVLPFAAVGPVPEPYLSEGLSDELRSQFSKMRALSVTARSSSMALDQKTLDAVAIAKKLSVATLLEGTVGRERGRLQVSVQLVHGGSGKVLWAERYERPDRELLKVQAEIASAVVSAVLPRFAAAGKAAPPPPTDDPVAYDLYLLARQKLRDLRLVTDEVSAASMQAEIVGLLNSAIAADPKFAQAHATLALATLNSALHQADSLRGVERTAAIDRLVVPHIERALALDPNNAEAYYVKGLLYRNTERPGSGAAYRRALELDPSNVPALTSLAWFEATSGHPDERHRLLLRARALEPMDIGVHLATIMSAFSLGSRDEVLASARRMQDTFPDNPFVEAQVCNAWQLAADYDEAMVCALQQLASTSLPPEIRASHYETLGDSAAYLGEDALAAGYFDEARESDGGSPQGWYLRRDHESLRHAASEAAGRHVSWQDWDLAEALSLAGHAEAAIDIYRRSGLVDVTRNESPLRVEGMRHLVYYAALLKRRGDAAAQQLLEQPDAFARSMLEHGASRTAVFRLLRARTDFVAGRIEQGCDNLQRTLDSFGRGIRSVRGLADDPAFGEVRDNPCFKSVIAGRNEGVAEAHARLPATFKKHGLQWPPP